MSVTDGTGSYPLASVDGRVDLHRVYGQVTLSGDLTLDESYRPVLGLDPGGSARDVTLPAERDGLWYMIVNRADAAENLVVKDDGGSTVATVNQNESAMIVCDGTTWYLVAIFTTAIS